MPGRLPLRGDVEIQFSEVKNEAPDGKSKSKSQSKSQIKIKSIRTSLRSVKTETF